MNRGRGFKPGLLVIAGLLVYFLYIYFNQQSVLNAKNDELKTIQARIGEEVKLTEELNRQKNMLNSDEYIEKVAREKLGMVKSGEKVFVDINK